MDVDMSVEKSKQASSVHSSQTIENKLAAVASVLECACVSEGL